MKGFNPRNSLGTSRVIGSSRGAQQVKAAQTHYSSTQEKISSFKYLSPKKLPLKNTVSSQSVHRSRRKLPLTTSTPSPPPRSQHNTTTASTISNPFITTTPSFPSKKNHLLNSPPSSVSRSHIFNFDSRSTTTGRIDDKIKTRQISISKYDSLKRNDTRQISKYDSLKRNHGRKKRKNFWSGMKQGTLNWSFGVDTNSNKNSDGIYNSPSSSLSGLGFRNIGNSCYLNAILQVLIDLDSFVIDLFWIPFVNIVTNMRQPSQTLYLQLLFLVARIHGSLATLSDNRAIDLTSLKNSIGKKSHIFSGDSQQDAYEFFGQVLDLINSEIMPFLPSPLSKSPIKQSNNSNDHSLNDFHMLLPTDRNFGMELNVTLICTKCGYERVISEDSYALSLDMPPLPTDPVYSSSVVSSSPPRPRCKTHNTPMNRKIRPNGDVYYYCPRFKEGCKNSISEPAISTYNNMQQQPQQKQQQTISVSSLLQDFFRTRKLELRCPNCDCNTVNASAAISSLPRILVLHTKRFWPNLLLQTYEKRTDCIDVDKKLDLLSFCKPSTKNVLPITSSDLESHSISMKKVLLDMDQNDGKSSPPSSSLKRKVTFSQDDLITPKSKRKRDNSSFSDPFHRGKLDEFIITDIDDDEEEGDNDLKRALKESLDSSREEMREENELQEVLKLSREEYPLFIDNQGMDKDSIDEEQRFEKIEYPDASRFSRNHIKESSSLPIYCIRSIVNHKGTAQSGHYTADTCFDCENFINWRRYNDSFVQDISDKDALGRASQSQGYMMFYVQSEILKNSTNNTRKRERNNT